MDPSPLIFVALAIAWAAYLIPKALEHHDAGARSRSISTFSERLRVLARREAVSRRRSTLVTTPSAEAPAEREIHPVVRVAGRPPVEVALADSASDSILETTQSGRLHLPSERPVVHSAERLSASAEAARRRRRVLGVLVFVFAATAAVALGHVISAVWLVAPSLLIVGWLVACRLMVTGERARRVVPTARPQAAARTVTVRETVTAFADDDTTSVPVVVAEVEVEVAQAPATTWEPVQAPLPTYVSKDAAPRRSITIDLDSTGVWTSGNTEADSALAREADAARAQVDEAPIKRASGA